MLLLLSVAPPAFAISAVGNVVATPGNAQVQLTWTNPADADFDHVNVYRATSRYGTPSLVQAVAKPATTWTDATAVNGTDYWYVLRAATATNVEAPDAVAGGVVSSWYTSTAMTTLAGQRMDATIDYPTTTGVNPFNQSTNFGVRWDGYVYVPTSETYTFYSDHDDTHWFSIDDVQIMTQTGSAEQSTAIALNAGWHKLSVTMHQGTGSWRERVAWSTPTLPKEIVPATNLGIERRTQATPRNVTLAVSSPNGGETLTNGSTNVTWTSSGTLSHFDVSYSVDGGATWGGSVATHVSAASTSREWLLPPGVAEPDVRIRIRALSAHGIVLASDTSDADFAIDTPPVPPVTDLAATPANGSVTLTWTNPVDPQFDHVEIYRAANEHDAATLVHTTASSATSSWADATVANGTEYWYRVRAVDTAGRSSPDLTTGMADARWYDGTNLDTYVGTKTSACLCDGFGNSDGPGPLLESPDYMDYDTFSGRYSGYLYVPEGGSWHFRAYRRSGARIWIGTTQLMNEWNVNATLYDTASSAIALSPGWHPFRFEFVTNDSDAHVHFYYKRTTDASWRAFDGANLARETTVSAVPHASVVTVTAPNGGETFLGHRPETISWSTTGGEASAVDLWYSTDGGATYPYLIVRGQALTGSYEWTVPEDLNSTQVRIRAVARTGPRVTIATDASDADLTVDTVSPPPPGVQAVSASPGDGFVDVTWTPPAPLGSTDRFRVYRSTIDGGELTQVHETTDATTTTWRDGTVANGTRYWYFVRTVDTAGREAQSLLGNVIRSSYFDGENLDRYRGTITEGGFEGGKSWGVVDGVVLPQDTPDELDNDYWSSRHSGEFVVPETSTYRIRVYRRGGARLWIDDRVVLDNWGASYDYTYDDSWMTVQLTGGAHRFRLEYRHRYDDAFLYFQHLRPSAWTWQDVTSASVVTERAANAVPTAATVALATPNGGEVYASQRYRDITWTTTDASVTSVALWLSTDGGTTWPTLIARGLPTSGTHSWLVPDEIQTSQARIRAVAMSGEGYAILSDDSDADFTIDTVTAPPPPVTAVAAAAGDPGEATVTWTMPAPLGSTDHVAIYRIQLPDGLPQRVHQTTDATTTSWTDVGLTPNIEYGYRVRTVDASGRENTSLVAGTIDATYWDGENYDTWKGRTTEGGFDSGKGWGTTDTPLLPGEAPDWLDTDYWSSRFDGWTYIPESTSYRLRVNRRGGARLWIDGRQVLDGWAASYDYTYDDSNIGIYLTKGWHEFRLDYKHRYDDAFLYFQHIRTSAWAWQDVNSANVARERTAYVIPHSVTVGVTSPNGGEAWRSRERATVSWTSAGAEATSVSLWYSLDGGATFPYFIQRGLPPSGSTTWLIPDETSSTQVRVRAVAHNSAGRQLAKDASDGDASIDTATVMPEPATAVTVTPADQQMQVSWTMPSPLGSADHVNIYRWSESSDSPTLVHTTADATTTSWTDTALTNGSRYWYAVRTVDAAGREQANLQTGSLDATYYDGENFDTFKGRVTEAGGFSKGWGTPDVPLIPTHTPDWLDSDYWSARYDGWFYAPATETYRMRVYRRGGARLWIDDRSVLDSWGASYDYTYDDTWMSMQLTKGWHPFRLEYRHRYDDAFLYFQHIRPSAWGWTDVNAASVAREARATGIPEGTTVTVDSPNGGEAWRANDRRTVTWSTTGTDGATVDLWYSTDGGATYPYLIARGQPLSGSYSWLVHDRVGSSQVRVRAVAVSGGEHVAWDASDADLTIDTASSPPPAVPGVSASATSGSVTVRWDAPNPIGSTARYAIYRATSQHDVPTRVHVTADATATSWTDATVANGQQYFYSVRSQAADGREAMSMVGGRINASYYDGENFDVFEFDTDEGGFDNGKSFGATDFPVTPDNPGEAANGDYWSGRFSGWFYAPATDSYRMRVYRRGGARLWVDDRQLLDNWGASYDYTYDDTWMTLQLTEGWHPFRAEYRHRYGDAFLYLQHIRPGGTWAWQNVNTADVALERQARATPNLPSVAVTSPDGGEAWSPTLERDIAWTSTGMPVGTRYRVRYSTDGGATYPRIIAQDLANGPLRWKPPEGLSSNTLRIRVEAVSTAGSIVAHDDSDANFSVTGSTLAPVTNASLTAGWSEITVSWTNPVSPALDHVNIYRSDEPWQLGTKVQVVAAPGSTWTDTSVVNGQRYWYTLRAADASDVESMTIKPGGLRGDYFAGADFNTFASSQIDPTIDMNWAAGGPAAAGGPVDDFSVRWTGYIRADVDAFWTIDTNRPTRDGSRVWIDGQSILNRWNTTDADATGVGYHQLLDGWHRITVEYHETTGNAYTALYHARSGLTRRVVPASELATEAQVVGVPLDPNPPTPNPAGTVQAQSATAIEWSMITVSDSESGLHATPYSYDNGSTWVAGSTYLRTGLTPNTAYTQTTLARDATLNATTARVLTARTHAVAPSIVADRATSTWLGPGSVAVTFSNSAVFGPGGVEYYRYAWTTNSAHTFDDTEPQWSSGNLVRTATTSGLYYLHARSYNADDVAGGQQVYGPFWIDAEAPTPNAPTATASSTLSTVDLEITGATDAHSGLHATPYSFDNGATWQAGPTNSSTGLAANTSVTRTVRVRDAIGNVSAPTVVTAATLPVDPGVTSVPAGGATWHPGGTTISVTSTVAFGPGTLWGYRWRTSGNAADPVLDTDAAWTSGALPVTIATTGTHYIRARSYNSTGTGGNTATLGPFHIDATPPPGTVPTAPSPTAVAPALSWSPVVDGDSGLSGYRVYRSTTSGTLGSQIASVAGTSYTDTDTLVDDTTYWYTVQAVDNVANEQTVGNTQIAVTYSSAPPTGSSISIAGGAGAVSTTAVTLTLTSSNAADMMVSNAPDFSGATWEPFSAARGWSLEAGADGSRSVYARFRNSGGTVSSAVVDTIDVDTTAPAPSPPSVTAVVGSATSITWSMQAVTDALVGLPADPYSLDDGATWQSGTSRTDTGLSPNTTYSLQARARDSLGNTTAQGTRSATTLPASPAVTSTPAPDPLDQPRGTTFTFTNDAGWGAGAVEYYRWAWTTSATHAFSGTEAMWSSGTLSRQEFVAGTYYMHVQAFNSDDVAGQTLTLGPYGVAPAQDDTELTMNVAATQTISCTSTGFAGSLLPGIQESADVACEVTSSVAGWNLALHADAAPFFTDFTDIPATPATWSAPGATDAVTGFTVTGTHADAAFSGGTLWRGFDGTTDIRIADDTGTSAGDTITTKVRVELGVSAPTAPGSRSQTITYTLNPGT